MPLFSCWRAQSKRKIWLLPSDAALSFEIGFAGLGACPLLKWLYPCAAGVLAVVALTGFETGA
jgi:hypothetical protein